jgi:hypothetical protein
MHTDVEVLAENNMFHVRENEDFSIVQMSVLLLSRDEHVMYMDTHTTEDHVVVCGVFDLATLMVVQ